MVDAHVPPRKVRKRMPKVAFVPAAVQVSDVRLDAIVLDVSLDDEARYYVDFTDAPPAPPAASGKGVPFTPPPSPKEGRGKRGTTPQERDRILAKLGLPAVRRGGAG